jgi:hypothetical protein
MLSRSTASEDAGKPKAILHRMDADGSNMLCLSASTLLDDRPAVLPDGRVLYTRWENGGCYGMPDWRPPDHYVRWIKRFGILPVGFDVTKRPIDPYATDRAYWRSLWHHPPPSASPRFAARPTD